jgi:MYXO-CTERM domain-containing protein
VGGSAIAIHAVKISGGTPKVTTPDVGDCQISCSYPCGQCDAARFPVDEYSVAVPGPHALAIHVLDGLGSGEAQAVVGSLNDDTFDPAPKQNDGVIGAAVQRASKVSYVVASSADDGASPTTMTYGVPGSAPGRHIVFDAPEDANGKSKVTATAAGERCVLSITAGAGFVGHPLMFTVATSADGCTVTDGTDVPAGSGVGAGGRGSGGSSNGGNGNGGGNGSGGTGNGNGGSGTSGTGGAAAAPGAKDDGGCGCRVGGGRSDAGPLVSVLVALASLRRRRPRSTRR